MYISEHPILGTDACQQMVNISVDGRPLQVKAGSMIAAALLANGIRVNRYTLKKHEARARSVGSASATTVS